MDAARRPHVAYCFDRFTLDLPRGTLLAPDGAELPLRPKSFALLRLLVENAGRLLDRDAIMAAVWPGVFVTDDSITLCVHEVRRALGDEARRLLRTVPRRGYLLAAEVSRAGLAAAAPEGPPMPAGGEAEARLRNRHRVVSKDDLLRATWGGRIVSESTVTSRLIPASVILDGPVPLVGPRAGHPSGLPTAGINAARKAVGDSGQAQHLIRTVPRKGVRFVGVVREEQEPAAPVDARAVAADLPRPALALLDKPSIAVLPFANLSGDPEQEYFADGMVEEIITALSRIGGLLVIARNSTLTYKGQAVGVKQVGRELGVRYVLEGSVRKGRQRVRIAVQLIEAATDAHLWADRFDGSPEDVFELQDKVALSVAGIIEPTLQTAEIQLSSGRPTTDLTAYELYLRALAPSAKGWDREQIMKVFGYLRQAIERDPHYGPALGLAAICHSDLDVAGWTDDEEANRAAALALARRALQTAGAYPDVLCNVAYVLAYFGEDIAVAMPLIDRALEQKPSFAGGWWRSGWVRLMDGQPEPALQHFEIGMRLNPRDKLEFALGIGAGHFFARRFEEAKAALLLALQEGPGWVPPYRFLASCYAHLGQLDEAREVVRRLRTMTPVVVPRATYWRNPEDRELFLSGL